MSRSVNDVVATALGQSKLSGLSEVLRSVAEAVDAYGSILWQVPRGVQLDAPGANLQILAEWFPDSQSSILYSLPIKGSRTGKAVLTGQRQAPQRVTSRGVYDDPFLKEAGIRTFLSLPLKFTDGSHGALNLYRNQPDRFTPADIELGERLASLLPELYQAIRDRISFALIHQVHEILHEAELSAPEVPLEMQQMKQVVDTICTLVADALQCGETSVFLEDRRVLPGVYELVATTWPLKVAKRSYRRDAAEGLTGYVLAESRPVTIPNLSRFDQDRSTIQAEYPNLRWRDSLNLAASVSKVWPDLDRRWLPLSFTAVPIVRGDAMLGVIRCSVARRCPYSFAGHEVDLLSLVAAQIGRSWGSWLNRRELEEENRTWQGLVQSIQKLNRFVLAELAKSGLSESKIFGEALRVTSSLIAGAEIMDVRLLDPRTRELYFCETHGAAWSLGPPEELERRRSKRFPIDDPQRKSAGAHVVQTAEVFEILDVSKEELYSETFPDTKRMIVAPMVSFPDKEGPKPTVLGVLDIRGTEVREFPRHAKDIAGLLGSQLGLYHDLATTFGNLGRLQRQQVQSFQDLRHQLKTPIGQAHKRVGQVLKGHRLEQRLEDDLLKVRGLVAKAMRVNMNTGLFASLARGEKLRANCNVLPAAALIKLLIEAGMDNQLMVESRRRIGFKVDIPSVERLGELRADRELLEQAMYDLLDNAYKYSYSGTEIRISGGGATRNRSHITIVNVGIAIDTYEIPLCVQRGWQGEAARSVSGSGSGIGLWIVDNIMKAHGGELVIMPTRANNETEIKLLFPAVGIRGERRA